MRAIKFRAWDKATNDWLWGITYTLHTSGGLITTPPNSELMQFTGLLDKNGQEVYEGDIVRVSNVHSSRPHIFEVFWREKFAGFFLKEVGAVDQQREWIDLMHGGNVADLEVIGNIYEIAQSAGRKSPGAQACPDRAHI